jgi:uncharacterized protein
MSATAAQEHVHRNNGREIRIDWTLCEETPTLMKPRISIVTLGVRNLNRAIHFYESSLGFERIPFDSDGIAFFNGGGVQLALYPWKALAEDAQVDAAGHGFSGITLAQNVDSSEEVVVLIDRAVAAGGRLIKPPQPVFWGGFSGYFADPDGHLWEIACGSEEYAKEKGA